MRSGDTLRQRVNTGNLRYFEIFGANRGILQAFFEASYVDPEIGRIRAEMRSAYIIRVRDHLERQCQLGRCRPIDPDAAALSLAMMVEGTAQAFAVLTDGAVRAAARIAETVHPGNRNLVPRGLHRPGPFAMAGRRKAATGDRRRQAQEVAGMLVSDVPSLAAHNAPADRSIHFEGHATSYTDVCEPLPAIEPRADDAGAARRTHRRAVGQPA